MWVILDLGPLPNSVDLTDPRFPCALGGAVVLDAPTLHFRKILYAGSARISMQQRYRSLIL
jgi:hypothetical protein